MAEMNMAPGVATQRATTRQGAQRRDTSRQAATNEDDGEAFDKGHADRIRQLEEDKRKLIDKVALKDVEIQVKDRLLVDLNEQRRQDINVITRLSESVGEWKEKYLQLAPPTDTAKEISGDVEKAPVHGQEEGNIEIANDFDDKDEGPEREG